GYRSPYGTNAAVVLIGDEQVAGRIKRKADGVCEACVCGRPVIAQLGEVREPDNGMDRVRCRRNSLDPPVIVIVDEVDISFGIDVDKHGKDGYRRCRSAVLIIIAAATDCRDDLSQAID